MRRLLFVLGILAAAIGGAHAQTSNATVVAACGTPPVTYTPGQAYPLTMDTTGRLCNGASGGSTPVTGTVGIDQTTPGSTNGVTAVPSASAAAGIVPVPTAAAANNLVIKASAGNVYDVTAVNLTNTTGFLVLLNATAAPADGTIAPLACATLPANGYTNINYTGVPGAFSVGATAVVTSAATCFTKTTGTITAFISGRAK